MVELVTFILKQFTEFPDQLSVTERGDGSAVTVVVRAAESDMGKIIGKQGRIAKALRTIVKAASSKEDKKYYVEIKNTDEE